MKAILVIFFFFLASCVGTKRTSNQFYEEDVGVNLFAFVGERISDEKFDASSRGPLEIDTLDGEVVTMQKVSLSLDAAFHCTYRVLQPVFNQLPSDTVLFDAYDHGRRPRFMDSRYVLLYLSKDSSGAFVHQKYQYDSLHLEGGQFKGPNGESIMKLFRKKKKGVLKTRGVFR